MEKTGKKISHVTGVLARSVRIIIENILREGGALQEIRMRIGQPLTVMIDGEEQILPLKERAHIVTKEEIKETIEYMSRYSLYAYENELRQGFLTLEGGHRVGVAGKVIVDRGKVKNIQYISSLNIRIAHEVIGCADELIPYITKNKKVCHTLIISPPRCGKTTLLRDLIRQISDGNEYVKGCSVGVRRTFGNRRMLYGDCAKQSRYAHGRSRLLSESRRNDHADSFDVSSGRGSG